MKRLLREALAGDAESQFNLGVFYVSGQDDNGHPIPGDSAASIKWLLAAAKQGLPRAQIKLAEAYAVQPSRAGSHAKAYFWFLLARGRLEGIHREKSASRLRPSFGRDDGRRISKDNQAGGALEANTAQRRCRRPTSWRARKDSTMKMQVSRARYRAVSMELAAFLDRRYVEMRILTDSGKAITVACDGSSILAVQRHIEQMRCECPEISTWALLPPANASKMPALYAAKEATSHDK